LERLFSSSFRGKIAILAAALRVSARIGATSKVRVEGAFGVAERECFKM
jgi:hypothetical protein